MDWLEHTATNHPKVQIRRLDMATICYGTATEIIYVGDRVEIRVEHDTGNTTVKRARRASEREMTAGTCEGPESCDK